MKLSVIRIGIPTLLLLLFVLSCTKKQENTPEETQIAQDTIPVSVISIKNQDFAQFGEYYGNVQGINEATIICYAGGQVEKISVKEGNYVKKGKSLARIDAEKFNTAYETAQLNEKIAKDNYERLKKHLITGNASQFQVDQANLAWLNSQTTRIDAQKAKKGALCIAPMSGIVTARFIDRYQEIAPGTPAFTVTQLHKVKITIGIPESEIEGVQEGNEAKISFSIYPGRTWKGAVHRITREASKMSKTFQAILYFDNPEKLIKPGLTAYVKLTLAKKANQIVVPTNAVLADGTENYVMVVNNNSALKKTVTLGENNKNQTIVTSGLETGSSLIIRGHHIVSTGSPVKVIN